MVTVQYGAAPGRDASSPRQPVGEAEEAHLLRLHMVLRPIVHKYREGKVKRTLDKGVKETLNFGTDTQSLGRPLRWRGLGAYLLYNGSVSK